MSIWHQIFSEHGIVAALFGALGGAVRSAVLRTTWRDGVRVIFVGSATAFGLGALSPVFIEWATGVDLPGQIADALGILSASAFVVGLIAVVLIERLIDKTSPEDRE